MNKKSQKIKIESLRVSSFITTLDANENHTVKGGGTSGNDSCEGEQIPSIFETTFHDQSINHCTTG